MARNEREVPIVMASCSTGTHRISLPGKHLSHILYGYIYIYDDDDDTVPIPKMNKLSSSSLDSLDMMRSALRLVLKDPGFGISESATEAQHAASSMLEALDCGESLPARAVVQELVCTVAACAHTRCGRMWGSLHKTRTSMEFIAAWERLMSLTLRQVASPILYQHVTDILFKELVKRQHPLTSTPKESQPLPPLNYEEHNTIRYVAGYVVRHLRQRLERGSHPLMEELVLCLEEMCEDDEEDDCSADWTKSIDRGGLKLVNSKTHQFFVAVETKVRDFFRVTAAQSLSDGMKPVILEAVTSDEDVLFFWSIVAAEWDEEEEQALLPMVIELWVTIRGFSFAKSFLEIYKQAKKKTVQKSKGLRKHLIK